MSFKLLERYTKKRDTQAQGPADRRVRRVASFGTVAVPTNYPDKGSFELTTWAWSQWSSCTKRTETPLPLDRCAASRDPEPTYSLLQNTLPVASPELERGLQFSMVSPEPSMVSPEPRNPCPRNPRNPNSNAVFNSVWCPRNPFSMVSPEHWCPRNTVPGTPQGRDPSAEGGSILEISAVGPDGKRCYWRIHGSLENLVNRMIRSRSLSLA
jgi:hypothetical protein